MLGRALDKLIGVFSPTWGLRRVHARATMDNINQLLGTSGQGGYDAGKLNKYTQGRTGVREHENSIARGNIQNVANWAWSLYRNNGHMRKTVRQLNAKVIGNGLMPQSQATRPDGQSHDEFRRRARQIWLRVQTQLDYRGRPGAGGQHFTALSKTALRATILSGETFLRFRSLSSEQQRARRTLLPLQVQLIHRDRLDESRIDDQVFRGVEFNELDERVAYHFLARHPSDPRAAFSRESTRIPASEIVHLFVEEDIDQVLGSPWLAAQLFKCRDVGDVEFNELTAEAMAACIVLGYRQSSGHSQFGVDLPSDWSPTDADGNPVTGLTPGMLINLGKTGELDAFNPNRPNPHLEGFLQHLLRSQAAAAPGTKGSTLTGDYKRASFASEAAADNDIWPELEELQLWFGTHFVQPVYERVITAGVTAGLFDGVLDAQQFNARRDDFLATQWQGPVRRSINQADDAQGAAARVKNGTSSPQIEGAKIGHDSLQILDDAKEWIEECTNRGLPDWYIAQTLGLAQAEQLAAQQAGGDPENENKLDGGGNGLEDEEDDPSLAAA